MPTKYQQTAQSAQLESTDRPRGFFGRICELVQKFLKFWRKPEEVYVPLPPPTDISHVGLPPSVQKEGLMKDDVIVMVVGLTGTGKSTFIQTASDAEGSSTPDTDKGGRLTRVTTEISTTRITFSDGANFVLVDTPGFYADTSDDELFTTIVNWVKDIHGRGLKLSGILHLHRITDNRIEDSDAALKKFAKALRPACGEDILGKVIITTTMWSDVGGNDEQETIKREKDLNRHWTKTTKRQPATLRFGKTKASARHILDHAVQAAAV